MLMVANLHFAGLSSLSVIVFGVVLEPGGLVLNDSEPSRLSLLALINGNWDVTAIFKVLQSKKIPIHCFVPVLRITYFL
jgi:hypothetical protein